MAPPSNHREILGDLIRFFLKISSNKRKGAKIKSASIVA
jgi:hypothetical protein